MDYAAPGWQSLLSVTNRSQMEIWYFCSVSYCRWDGLHFSWIIWETNFYSCTSVKHRAKEKSLPPVDDLAKTVNPFNDSLTAEADRGRLQTFFSSLYLNMTFISCSICLPLYHDNSQFLAIWNPPSGW